MGLVSKTIPQHLNSKLLEKKRDVVQINFVKKQNILIYFLVPQNRHQILHLMNIE
jgi:hypothetical protein